MRNNKNGSALIWAIAVIMVLTTIVGAGLTIASSYYNRSLVTNSKRQAYLTAKSITTNIAEKIINYNPLYKLLIPEKVGESTLLNIEDLPSDMGEVVNAYIVKSSVADNGDTRIVISVAVSYAGEQDVVNAELKQLKGEKGWMLMRYFKGDS